MENKKIRKIRTRFAPSPTGMFHIGSARTALFNYLFAKHNNGDFILRLEDTDQKRSTEEFEDDILDGLSWLGLNWEEGPVGQALNSKSKTLKQMNKKLTADSCELKAIGDFGPYRQTERLEIYNKYADELIAKGAAYKKDGAIWFKLDSYKNDVIKYHDLILGDLEFSKDTFNDFVLIKSDGIPLYQFACVIDDYLMEISHVIRGADHINSTPQQIMIYEVFGWRIPEFAHIPLILNQNKTKMSKRHDPVSVTRDFREKGYLANAMNNYIALLGWNPKTEEEFFTLYELVKRFELKNVNKSPAVFDIDKLNYFNSHYIREISNSELAKMLNSDEKTVSIIKERLTKLSDFDSLTSFIKKLPSYNSQDLIFRKSDKEKTILALEKVLDKLNSENEEILIEKANELLKSVVEENKLTNGDVFWPVRFALSGVPASPSPAELIYVLGKMESAKRLTGAVENLKS